jgi:diadenosine tetraphosphatase ApaH/serine/threonine PP2A family protein phosphatase
VNDGKATFDLRGMHGPFDIIGDVHGCIEELHELLGKLGYSKDDDGVYRHADARRLVFIGDLGDRGPDSAESFSLAMRQAEGAGSLYTPGNHCNKLMRYLKGSKVQLSHGLDDTIKQVEARSRYETGFRERLREFIERAPTYLWLDGGALVVAHAGIKEHQIGRDGPQIQTMCLYGDITGRKNPDGTPQRLDWAAHYTGNPAIVYGHTPVSGPIWRNNTINIDQGCVFGGWLTAVRWPECEVVQVPAKRAYYTVRTPAFLVGRVRELEKGVE